MFSSSKQHLADVQETYFEHQQVAFKYAANCFIAAMMALVHGIVPGYFQTSASDLVKRMASNRKLDD